MDLTQFGMDKFEAGAENSGGEKVKPGRYNLTYSGSDVIEGANGWKALKIMFDVDGEIISVNKAFTMAHNTSTKTVEIGKQSLSLMLNAMGVTSMKNTDELLGKTVNVMLTPNERGYLEVADDFGRSWQVASESGEQNPQEVLPKDEIFPSDEDESDMPF